MVDANRGRNINKTGEVDHSIVPINSVTATTIALPRDKRITFSACLEPGVTDVDVYIRYYAASLDDIKQGRDVLTRFTFGAIEFFRPIHVMLPDNIYIGEISAITLAGTVNLLTTES